jgi:hypothetical protein
LCNRSTSRSTLHGIDANIEQEAGTSAEAFRAVCHFPCRVDEGTDAVTAGGSVWWPSLQ